jgi:excisionase family DNA binding protein
MKVKNMFEEYQDILTTDELAQILRLNERTVIKLAKEGQLPAAKIASQFRFSKEKILEWLELQMNHYSDDLLADMEKGMLEKAVPVHKLLVESHIELNMKATNKEEVLVELTEIAKKTGLLRNQDELLKSLQSREELCSTALGNGIAMPHPRKTSWDVVRNLIIIIGISKKGIDFGASDDQPVHIFIMLAIPLLPLHLQFVSRLARIFHDKTVMQKIMDSTSERTVIEIIQEKEQELNQNNEPVE